LSVLIRENILLKQKVENKFDAIRLAGQLLVDNGYVFEGYVDDMIERENSVSTYVGNNIAIPHGIEGSQEKIRRSGIVLVQIPDGVDFGPGKKAKLVIGIAGKGNTHLDILSKLALKCLDKELVKKLITSICKEEIMEMMLSSDE
jgi:PTS system mannitol-specific IIA component